MDLLFLNKTHFAAELEARGHRIVIAAPPSEYNPSRHDHWSLTRYDIALSNHNSIESVLERLPSGFAPDAVVYHDDSHPYFRVEGLERCSLPILFYQVDAHIHYRWFPMMAGLASAVWVAQRDYLPYYVAQNPSSEWVPLWAPTWNRAERNRDIEVSFRGSLDRVQRAARVEFFNAVNQHVAVDVAAGPYQDVYSRSRIVLNESIGDDLNFRIFEAISSGAMVLTPRVKNGLDLLFRDGVHLVTYERGNAAEAVEKIRYYLAHEEERRAIAEAGAAEVARNHNPHARALKLERALQHLVNEPFVRPHANLAAAYRALWSAFVDRRIFSQSQAQAVITLLASQQFDPPPSGWDTTLPFLISAVLDVVESPDCLRISEIASLLSKHYSNDGALRFLALEATRRGAGEHLAAQLAKEWGIEPGAAVAGAQEVHRRLQANSPFR